MTRKTLTVCFAFLMIFLVLSTVYLGTVVGVNEAEMPKYSVGDKWKGSIDFLPTPEREMGLVGTVTCEVTGDSAKIHQFGENYVCYEISYSYNMTVYGAETTGTWTENRKTYDQKSDFSEVKDTSTANWTLTYDEVSMTTKIVMERTYNPPRESSSFPLTVGKSWSAVTTKTTITQTTIDGEIDQETNTTLGTWNYLILRTESTIVSAGEFDTFVIKATDPDGSYFELYYSPEVGSLVKEMAYDENGTLEATFELLEYNYAAAEEKIPWLLVIIGIVIAAAVIASGVGYVLYKRRKSPAPTAPPTPPTEQPPQPTTSQCYRRLRMKYSSCMHAPVFLRFSMCVGG